MTSTDASPSRESLSDGDRERLLIEREHLLDSLDDLDAEFAAGDIDRSTTTPSETTTPLALPG